MDSLSPPQPVELELLHRIGSGPDVRLACQALLVGPSITLQRLVPADEDEAAARDPLGWSMREPSAAAGGA
jgi:hypothetical protein